MHKVIQAVYSFNPSVCSLVAIGELHIMPMAIVAKQQQIRPNKGSLTVTYEQCRTLSLANRMVSASTLHKHPQWSINENDGLSHSTTGNFLEAWAQP